MLELDVLNVRELEDFLINECMYAVSIIKKIIIELVALHYILFIL